MTAAIALVPFLVMCAFAHPQVDDFSMADVFQARGFVAAQAQWYETWTGRFTSIFLINAFLATFDFVTAYSAAPVIMISSTFLAGFLFARSMTGTASALRVATVIAAFALAGTPSTRDTCYWLTSAAMYGGGTIFLLVTLAVMLAPRPSRSLTALAAVLGLLTAGTNETVMFLLVLGSGTWIGLGLLRQVRTTARHVALLIGTTIGAVVVYVAPGNAMRSTHFDQGGQLVDSLVGSARMTLELLPQFVLQTPILEASLLGLLLSPILLRTAPRLRGALRCIPLPVTLAIPPLVLFAGVFPAFWSMGNGPPIRAVATVWAVLAITWFGVALPSIWLRLRRRVDLRRPWLRAAGAGLLAVGLLVHGNTPRAVADLVSLRAYRYSQENLRRYEAIAAAAPAAVLEFSPIEHRPTTMFGPGHDLVADPKDWRNVNFAQTFGLKAVICR